MERATSPAGRHRPRLYSPDRLEGEQMPAQRLTMRRVRELLRLHYGMGVSARAIARELGVSRSAVQDYLARATAAGLTWPLADDLTDGVLEERLFAASGAKPGVRRRAEPDWAALVREMKRPGVNLTVLWEEYGAAHPGGYSYSRFCELYRDFERRLSPTMRQHHVAGDKVFVDYSGKTIAIVERETGEVRPAQLFIAVLGASNYTYAAVSWTQALPDWISAHVQMFAFFQGCPRLVVPDNLKSGVHKPSFYDPEINRSYARMATHYRVGILPARPLLFGAAHPDPRTGRGLHRRAHHRGLPSRQACRRASAPLWRPAPWHGSRAHAQCPSPLCRVDARTLPALGTEHRPRHRRADHRHPRSPAAPRTGFPYLPGGHAVVARP